MLDVADAIVNRRCGGGITRRASAHRLPRAQRQRFLSHSLSTERPTARPGQAVR
jgi:hypothetical protein